MSRKCLGSVSPSTRNSRSVLSNPAVRASCPFGCQATQLTAELEVAAALRSTVRFTASSCAISSTGDHARLLRDSPRSAEITFRMPCPRSREITPRSPEISRDFPRSPEITRDYAASAWPEIASERPRSDGAPRRSASCASAASFSTAPSESSSLDAPPVGCSGRLCFPFAPRRAGISAHPVAGCVAANLVWSDGMVWGDGME